MVIQIQTAPTSTSPNTKGQFHLVFEEVGLMANSANYFLSKISINTTVLEDSVKEFQNIAFVNDEIKGPPKNIPLKKTLLGTLPIHMSDAEAKLERVWRL
jgi:hypothetical protein